MIGAVLALVNYEGMISALLKKLIKECGLTQQKLADLMGVDVSRVKNLCAGRLQKLTREEGEALIRKLHVRGDWLATGEGPMLQSEGERNFTRKLDVLGSSAKAAARLGLSESEGKLMTELLYYAETGNTDGLRKALSRLSELSPTEAALLDNYRHSPRDAQDALIKTSAAFAQSTPKGSIKGRSKASITPRKRPG